MSVPSLQNCFDCEFVTSKPEWLQRHVRKKHGKVALRCPWCAHCCDSSVKLNQHKRQHHKDVRLRCLLCEFSSRSALKWANHVTSCHVVNISSLISLVSLPRVSNTEGKQHCSQIYDLEQSEPSLKGNSSIIPQGILSTKVSELNLFYNYPGQVANNSCNSEEILSPKLHKAKPSDLIQNEDSLIKSEKILPSKVSELNQSGPSQIENSCDTSEAILSPKSFSCSVCGYSTSKERKLTKHIGMKHPLLTVSNVSPAKSLTEQCQEANRNLKCPYCTNLFPSIRDIAKHCKTEHGLAPPFTCTECSKQFPGIYRLVTHMGKHSGEKPFACDFCLYKTSLRNSLVLHMRTHSLSRPFKCAECGFSTKTASNLVVHKRMHSKELPYTCKYCKYRSYSASNLSRHMKKHTNTRPHKCTFCDFAAIQKPDLVAHLRVHTGERPFQCKVCRKTYTKANSLARHMKNSGCRFL